MDETKPGAVVIVEPERYRSYLLRMWHESPGAPWRVQVHCVQDGSERRFAGLAGLFEFLAEEAGDREDLRGGSKPLGSQ